MLKKYIEYIRDNPQRYWFKRKLYGWGWEPATWQGWSITLGYIGLMLLLAFSQEKAISEDPASGSNILEFLLPLILLTATMIFIAYKKGEKPAWQWGFPDKDKEKSL